MKTKKLWTSKHISNHFAEYDQAVAKVMRDEYESHLARLQAIIDHIDECIGTADENPDIFASEAARRFLIDKGHPAFMGETYEIAEKAK